MIRIILIFLILTVAWAFIRWFMAAPPGLIARRIRTTIIVLAIMGLGYLAAMGRLSWLLALVGAFLALLLRIVPHLLRYAPLFQNYWARYRASRGAREEPRRPADSVMTVEEAYRVLGLKLGASPQDIVEAHRRLIQKMHPDRGGSEYIAAKINQAREILLRL